MRLAKNECRRYPAVVLVKNGKTTMKKYWIPYRASLVRNDKSGL
ncbi:hypothetical protein ASZ90_007102 [hydrocarbon metagenome]|uniref:Uncharacterized protein n=1 Tax=hydrocarbon metagenome TaxID=938273 RepID=A0A0W8FQR0_9ZZZZ